MNKVTLLSLVETYGLSPCGESVYKTPHVLCPVCKGGTTGERSFVIYVEDYNMYWRCYRGSCGESGGNNAFQDHQVLGSNKRTKQKNKQQVKQGQTNKRTKQQKYQV